jgi:hypothetical protein
MPDDWYLTDCITTEVSLQTVKQCTARNSSTCTRPSTYLSLLTTGSLSPMLATCCWSRACLALSRGLNYDVTLVAIPVEDMLSGAEKTIVPCPRRLLRKSVRKTVRTPIGSCKSKDNLTGAGPESK